MSILVYIIILNSTKFLLVNQNITTQPTFTCSKLTIKTTQKNDVIDIFHTSSCVSILDFQQVKVNWVPCSRLLGTWFLHLQGVSSTIILQLFNLKWRAHFLIAICFTFTILKLSKHFSITIKGYIKMLCNKSAKLLVVYLQKIIAAT